MVVGDQSSGKSSLLEGLTGITFPTHSGLCTRFATRIILRRSVEEHVRVSIIPGPSAKDAAHREALLAFHPEIDMKGLTGPQFTKIMDEVSAELDIGSPANHVRLQSLWVYRPVLKPNWKTWKKGSPMIHSPSN